MLRLVIADDEKYTRDCIVDFTDWSRHGIEIVGTAGDGPEALALISEQKPDIAILDIQMPGISGLEVIERLKESGLDTVFIIVSSYDKFEYARQAVHLGVEEYLLKPFLPDDFIAAIYKAAERIRCLRGLIPPPGPASSFAGSGALGPLHFGLTSDVAYPVHREKMLLEALQVGSMEDVLGHLHDFFVSVEADNPEEARQNSCGVILYIALYRFCSLRGIALSQEDFVPPSFSSLPNISQRLHAYLHRICEIIYNALVQQRAGSHLVKQALAYIREHYSEDLSLEVLAENLLVSPSYLSSLFRQNIGKTYIEYLNSYRISRAKELMQEEPYLKNYEIAVRLGYSPKYFAQIFKQLEGVTLSDYRQNLLP